MAFIFLQEDPKVSVGDTNDDPATIPTPIELGSLLITYAATGTTGQVAAAYAALEVAGAEQWVPIAGAGGVTGPTGGGTPNQLAKFTSPTTIGDSQIFDDGSFIAATAATTASLIGGSGVSIAAVTGDVTITAGAEDIELALTTPGRAIVLNGALFLGSYSVAMLPPGATQAMAFATDVRNLDSGAAYPAIEAVGTGGLVVRGTDGVWRLASTNIVAQA